MSAFGAAFSGHFPDSPAGGKTSCNPDETNDDEDVFGCFVHVSSGVYKNCVKNITQIEKVNIFATSLEVAYNTGTLCLTQCNKSKIGSILLM